MDLKGKLTLFGKCALVVATMSYLVTSASAEFAMVRDKVQLANYNRKHAAVFEETLNYYDEYLDSVGYIIDDSLEKNIGEYDVLDVFAVYNIMEENGNLSYGTDFVRDSYPVEIGTCWGINVVTGEGVCRHSADNLSNVLNEMGFEASVVLGECFTGEEANIPNHALVYVEYNNEVYLLDPMNKTIFIRGEKYYVSVHNDNLFFQPSLTCDIVYGFSNDTNDVYINKKNIEDKTLEISENYIAKLNLIYDLSIDFDLYEKEYLQETEMEIYKDFLFYKKLYEVIKERLGEEATEEEIMEEIYNTYSYLTLGKRMQKYGLA